MDPVCERGEKKQKQKTKAIIIALRGNRTPAVEASVGYGPWHYGNDPRYHYPINARENNGGYSSSPRAGLGPMGSPVIRCPRNFLVVGVEEIENVFLWHLQRVTRKMTDDGAFIHVHESLIVGSSPLRSSQSKILQFRCCFTFLTGFYAQPTPNYQCG